MKFSSFLLKSLCCLLLLVMTTHCCSNSRRVKEPDSVIANHLLDSTVAMVTLDEEGNYYAYCSGVWISKDKFLTAKHCVSREGGKNVIGTMVRFKNRQEVNIAHNQVTLTEPHWGLVYAVDVHYDLALVTAIDGSNHSIARISREEIEVGSEVKIVGHTSGMMYTYMIGVVSAIREDVDESNDKFLQISSPAYKGNSGGGVYDINGNLLGICSFLYTRAPNMVSFVHRDLVIEFLEDNLN